MFSELLTKDSLPHLNKQPGVTVCGVEELGARTVQLTELADLNCTKTFSSSFPVDLKCTRKSSANNFVSESSRVCGVRRSHCVSGISCKDDGIPSEKE